jgi:hypothetical protein
VWIGVETSGCSRRARGVVDQRVRCSCVRDELSCVCILHGAQFVELECPALVPHSGRSRRPRGAMHLAGNPEDPVSRGHGWNDGVEASSLHRHAIVMHVYGGSWPVQRNPIRTVQGQRTPWSPWWLTPRRRARAASTRAEQRSDHPGRGAELANRQRRSPKNAKPNGQHAAGLTPLQQTDDGDDGARGLAGASDIPGRCVQPRLTREQVAMRISRPRAALGAEVRAMSGRIHRWLRRGLPMTVGGVKRPKQSDDFRSAGEGA